MSDTAPTPINPLEQAMANILQKTVNAVEAGVNFLSEQLPDVIQQLLVWHAVKSGVWFVITLISAVILARWTYKVFKYEDWTEYGPIPLITAIGSVGLVVVALNNIDWLQILVAPKLYLIEYAAEIYKGR